MEKITLYSFWTFMVICGTLAIGGIWFGDMLPEAYFKTIGTAFILGFACFLLWTPQVVYRFLGRG